MRKAGSAEKWLGEKWIAGAMKGRELLSQRKVRERDKH